MLTTMTEEDWTIVLMVFEASRSRRGDKGRERPEVSRSSAVFRGSQHHLAGSPGEVRALEQRLETVLALEPVRHLRSLLRCAGGNERTAHLVQMFDSTVVRAHVSAAGAKGGSMIRRSAARAAASPPRFT